MMACACRSVNSKRLDRQPSRAALGVDDSADQFDDGVEMVERPVEAEQDVLAVAGLAQQVIGTAADHVDAVLDEPLDDVDQAQFARLSVDDGQHDDAEVHLHLRVLVQVVQNDFGLLAALQLEDDAHAVAVALVADFGDAFELLLVDQRSGVLDQARFVHLVRNLGDDDGFAVLAHVLDGGSRAQSCRLPRPRV